MVEFKRVDTTQGAISKLLFILDEKMYPEPDLFEDHTDWATYQAFLVLLNGQVVGSVGFQLDADLTADLEIGEPGSAPGCFYVVGTGVLPEYQGQGIGHEAKKFQIEFARKNGSSRMVSYPRASNTKIRAINEASGFKTGRTIPGFYDDEDAVAMELVF